jgi:hypothetical protein
VAQHVRFRGAGNRVVLAARRPGAPAQPARAERHGEYGPGPAGSGQTGTGGRPGTSGQPRPPHGHRPGNGKMTRPPPRGCRPSTRPAALSPHRRHPPAVDEPLAGHQSSTSSSTRPIRAGSNPPSPARPHQGSSTNRTAPRHKNARCEATRPGRHARTRGTPRPVPRRDGRAPARSRSGPSTSPPAAPSQPCNPSMPTLPTSVVDPLVSRHQRPHTSSPTTLTYVVDAPDPLTDSSRKRSNASAGR